MTLQHEMEKLGRILAYDRDLIVQVRGTRAYSVPGRVVIPNAETYAHLGPNAERMLHGLLDHECGHARFTDHTIMERARKRGGESLASLVNSLEDGRIERLMGEEYVGCKQNLHRKNRWFWEDADWQKTFAASDPWAAFCLATTLVVRNSVSVPEIERVRPEVSDLVRAALAYGMDRFDTCKTSDEVFKLAVALWERFREPPPPPPPPPPPQPSEDDEEDEDEQQGDDEDENDEDEDESPSSGDSGSPEEDDDAEEGDGDEAAGSGPSGDDEDDTDGDDGGDAGPHDNAGDEKHDDGKPSQPEGEDENDGDEESDESDASDDDGDPADEEGAGSDDEPDEGEDDGDESADSAPEGAGDDEGGEPEDGEDEGAAGAGGDDDADEGGEGDGPTLDGGKVDPYRAIREMRLDKWEKGESVVDPEEAIAKLMEQYENDSLYRIFSNEFDVERDFHERPSHEALDEHFDDSPESIERDAKAASAALTQAFEVALKARRERRPIGGHDEGEIDPDILGEFSVGSAPVDTIFRQYIAEDDRDVTVAIMLDCSGSMAADDPSRDFLARRVANALHLALSACQIEHEITGFTTVSDSDCAARPWTADMPELEARFKEMRTALIEAHEHGVDPALFAREFWHWNGGVRIRGVPRHVNAHDTKQVLHGWPLLVPVYAVFKPYGVSDIRGLRYAHGSHENLDGEAVLWQARRLAARPEKRRVMFVLSDGMPSGSRDNALGAAYLKECVQRVIAAGIEVYGIGIETDAVKHFYPRHWIANSVEHLMEVAFTSFAQVITEGRTEVECVTL